MLDIRHQILDLGRLMQVSELGEEGNFVLNQERKDFRINRILQILFILPFLVQRQAILPILKSFLS